MLRWYGGALVSWCRGVVVRLPCWGGWGRGGAASGVGVDGVLWLLWLVRTLAALCGESGAVG